MSIIKRELTGIGTGFLMILSVMLLSGISGRLPKGIKDIISCAFYVYVIFLLFRRLYLNYNYSNGKADYLLLPTKNDLVVKIAYMFFGFFTVIAMAIYFYSNESIDWPILTVGILISILLLINFLTALPQQKIILKDSKLYAAGLETPLDLLSLESLEIKEDKILFKNSEQLVTSINNLALDNKAANNLLYYLASHGWIQEIEIIISVS